MLPYRLPYRALQKLIVLEGVRTLVAPVDHLAAVPTKPGVAPAELVQLDPATLVQYIAQDEAPNCEPFARRLDEPRLHCFGAIAEKSLVAFLWLHEGSAEAEMNCGYHPGTATPIALVPSAAFVFHVYTAPSARGQGRMGAVLGHAARTLQAERGIESFVTTTEIINRAARAGLTKVGFEERGIYWRFGLGRKTGGWYPRPTSPILGFHAS